jgi:hypothetical protein
MNVTFTLPTPLLLFILVALVLIPWCITTKWLIGQYLIHPMQRRLVQRHQQTLKAAKAKRID